MLLASGSQDKTVKLWDVATRQNIGILDGHSIWVYSVSFSPDERTLASTGGNTVKLWDVTTQRNIGILPHGADVGSVSFSRDGGTLASGAVDGTVKLWDVASGANFAAFGNMSGVNSLSFSSDGVTLASGTADGTIELWDTSGLMRERLEALAEIDIPDPNLRAAIATALGKPPSASIVRGAMATLPRLEASYAGINNLTGLEGSTNLTFLSLWGNNISDISAVAGLTKLERLYLDRNNITDISPLVANTGLESGDEVYILGNPLSYPSIYTHIPVLQERGVEVFFDNRTPQRIHIVSGNDQQGLPGAALKKPFVVEIQDEHGVAFEGVPVTFSVTVGGGTLSTTSTATNTNVRAESALTLGPKPGTNTVEVGVTGIQEKQSVSAIAELPPIPQDVNRDDVVNILDLVLVAGAFGNAAAAPSAWYRDLEEDLLSGVAIAFPIRSLDPSLSTRLIAPTRADVGRWLSQAQQLNLADATSLRGILFLDQLLAALIPKETALLPNYPNPFNPETWIPYQLARDADVMLTIHALDGQLVRLLPLGVQPAGTYYSRSRAAYWNGKNEFGEPVASGLYFYTLTAGDFSATRKMLIRK